MRDLLSLFKSVRDGRTSPSRLQFLDLEFNARTKTVFEVGMCDANGVATMDCRTPYAFQPSGTATANPDKRNAMIEDSIRRSVQRHNCVDNTMSAHKVAERLRNQGVGPRTIFVTWHTNTTDLTALRQWLEAEGEAGILPGDSKCIPVIQYFRPNFKIAKAQNGRPFPLSLPVIFPLLMTSRHYLFGRNHHAVVDAQQLYFMVRVFEMMCEQPRNRPEDWLGALQRTPDPATDKFQTTLTARKRESDSGGAPAAQRMRLRGPPEGS
jgi:hypothetical protein